MATYWENSCSFGLRYIFMVQARDCYFSFSHFGFWSGHLFLIALFPESLPTCTFLVLLQIYKLKVHVKITSLIYDLILNMLKQIFSSKIVMIQD